VDYHGIAIGSQGSYIGSGDARSRYHHTCIETDQAPLNLHKLKHKSHFIVMQLLVNKYVLGGCSNVDIKVTLEDKLPRIPVKVKLAPLPVQVLCSVVRVLHKLNIIVSTRCLHEFLGKKPGNVLVPQ